MEVTDVSEFTGSAEILDGRVKTLHPRLHAALLARRDDPAHCETLEARGDRADRPRLRQPLPVRADGRPQRGRPRRGDREHRHRRADDDPRGGQEPRRRRGRGQAGVLRRGARRAGGVRRGDLASPPATGSRTRRSPRPPATTPRSAPGSRPTTRTSPSTWWSPTRRCSTSPTARTPTSAAALYAEVGAAQPRALAGLEAARPSALLQQRARPRLGPAAGSPTSTDPACVIVKHNNPCGVAIGEDAAGGVREGARLRPDVRLRRRDRTQPPGRRGARRRR